MKFPRRKFLHLAAGAAALFALTNTTLAQDWPTRPVTLVVPFAAGGPNDVVARILAPRLSEILGQSVIIENVAGAGGMTGALRVARAAPDGYQFVLGNSGTMPRPISRPSPWSMAGRRYWSPARISRRTRSPISSPT